jgi:hypothetical protein
MNERNETTKSDPLTHVNNLYNNRVFTDTCGDACPPDQRYDATLRRVLIGGGFDAVTNENEATIRERCIKLAKNENLDLFPPSLDATLRAAILNAEWFTLKIK